MANAAPYFMAGLTGFAQQLGAGLEERKQSAAKAATLRKALSLYDPENKDTYATQSLAELEGSMTGLTLEREGRRQQLLQQALGLDIEAKERAALGETAFGRFLQSYGELSPQGPWRPDLLDQTGQLSAEGRTRLALQAGGPELAYSGAAPQLMRALMEQQEPQFQPGGALLRIGEWDIPWFSTSRRSIQGIPELATGPTGELNPRFQPRALTAGEAVRQYNNNQERLRTLRQNRNLADDPKLGTFFDKDALELEINQIEAEQKYLRRYTGLPQTESKSGPAQANRPEVTPYKKGQTYRGGSLRYLGGDPNDPASWETVLRP